MDTLPRNFFFGGGDRWRSYWGTLASCCWLSFAVVCFKRKCGLLFFPLGECLQSGQAHKVDTREIVYHSFFGDNPATRPQFSQLIDQRTFQLERQGLLLMRLYFIRAGRFHQQMCAHTHTGALFVLFWKPDRTCDVDVTFQAPWFGASCVADQDQLFFDSVAIATQIMFTCENSFDLILTCTVLFVCWACRKLLECLIVRCSVIIWSPFVTWHTHTRFRRENYCKLPPCSSITVTHYHAPMAIR